MPLPKIVLVEDPQNATPKTGNFVSVWLGITESIGPLKITNFCGHSRSVLAGIVMPYTKADSFTNVRPGEVFRIIRGIFGTTPTTVFMTEEVAKILVPEMLTPCVPIDLQDESVSDAVLNAGIGQLLLNLSLPAYTLECSSVKRVK